MPTEIPRSSVTLVAGGKPTHDFVGINLNVAGLSYWSKVLYNGNYLFLKIFTTIRTHNNTFSEFKTRQLKLFNCINKISSSTIPKIHYVFEYGTSLVKVTDYIESTFVSVHTLDEHCKIKILHSLAESYAMLHNAGLVHIDVKFENILFVKTDDGCYDPIIIDFDGSYCKTFGDHINLREINFNVEYQAPEILIVVKNNVKSEITEKIDIFAFGVLMHYLWTGEFIEFDSTYGNLAQAIKGKKTVNLSMKIPGRIKDIIRNTINEDPTKRYSMQQIKDILEDINTKKTTKTAKKKIIVRGFKYQKKIKPASASITFNLKK